MGEYMEIGVHMEVDLYAYGYTCAYVDGFVYGYGCAYGNRCVYGSRFVCLWR